MVSEGLLSELLPVHTATERVVPFQQPVQYRVNNVSYQLHGNKEVDYLRKSKPIEFKSTPSDNIPFLLGGRIELVVTFWTG